MPMKFRAQMQAAETGTVRYVTLPVDPQKTFGTKGRVAISGTMSAKGKKHKFRSSFMTMGGPHMMVINRAMQAALGTNQPGTIIEFAVVKDEKPRTVAVSARMKKLLSRTPGAREKFEALAYTYKKEFVLWLDGAKQEETRRRREAKFLEMLRKGEHL